LLFSDHGVEDGRELAHTGDDGNLFGLTFGQEALVAGLDDRVADQIFLKYKN